MEPQSPLDDLLGAVLIKWEEGYSGKPGKTFADIFLDPEAIKQVRTSAGFYNFVKKNAITIIFVVILQYL